PLRKQPAQDQPLQEQPMPAPLSVEKEKTAFRPEMEGRRMIHRKTVTVPETTDPEPKLRIDKKNLILYSEILKPKFDD
ncbi:MAG: hypothetical protein K5849_02570, partial [Bacteroidales bacterium]|nr:hypothetical protein [Bacteroidales bacterium]